MCITNTFSNGSFLMSWTFLSKIILTVMTRLSVMMWGKHCLTAWITNSRGFRNPPTHWCSICGEHKFSKDISVTLKLLFWNHMAISVSYHLLECHSQQEHWLLTTFNESKRDKCLWSTYLWYHSSIWLNWFWKKGLLKTFKSIYHVNQ